MELGLQLGGVALLVALYAAAYARVRRRTRRRRPASFAVAVALLLVAFVTPLDGRFSTHMVQHLLLGDLAPLFLVLALDGPLLRPALAFRPVRRLRALAHPFVALPLWAANLCAWHVPALYDAALAHAGVHALQHLLFFTCGALLWSALLEPVPGPRWFTTGPKLVYVGAMWLVSLGLSQFFLWSGHPYYTGYRNLSNQRAGGGVMLVEGSLVMIGVVVWLLLRALATSQPRPSPRAAPAPPRAAPAPRRG